MDDKVLSLKMVPLGTQFGKYFHESFYLDSYIDFEVSQKICMNSKNKYKHSVAFESLYHDRRNL